MKELELLSSSLRVLGVNLDIPTLDLIFTLQKELSEKEANISLAEIHELSAVVAQKYNLDSKQ